ncbi:hypothetical protein KCP69_05620 [Salmonella enterica subsp. enterica]|nr:hypothetical protein KCP69_05620 [Salmonella enterica subsp. enterica]
MPGWPGKSSEKTNIPDNISTLKSAAAAAINLRRAPLENAANCREQAERPALSLLPGKRQHHPPGWR